MFQEKNMQFDLQAEESIIYNKVELLFYLYDSFIKNQDIKISFGTEGVCAEHCGLYKLLDEFCLRTNFQKENITIYNSNMLENHEEYNIVKTVSGWYEIKKLQQWATNNKIEIEYTPKYHFGNFVGASRWARLWLASYLYHNYKDKTLQTFHSGLFSHYRTKPTDGIYDTIELDLLNQYNCDSLPEIINFLQHCPLILPEDFEQTKQIEIPKDHPASDQERIYPLQVPANMNIIHQYNKIFVDIVMEMNTVGNCFMASEKIFRCFIARRPFVVMSNSNFLTNLRKLGFKTFDNWFNEDYDAYIAEDRVKNIKNTINQIAQKSKSQISDILNEMQETLNHNYLCFMNLKYQDLKNNFGAQ